MKPALPALSTPILGLMVLSLFSLSPLSYAGPQYFTDIGGGHAQSPEEQKKAQEAWEKEIRPYSPPKNVEIFRCDTHPEKRKLFDDFLEQFKALERHHNNNYKAVMQKQAELRKLVAQMWPPACFDKFMGDRRTDSLFRELCPKLHQPPGRWGIGPDFASHDVRTLDRFLISEREWPEDYGTKKWNGARESSFIEAYDGKKNEDSWYIRAQYDYSEYDLHGVLTDTDHDGFTDRVVVYRKYAFNRQGETVWESRPWRTYDLKNKATQKELGLEDLLNRPRTEQCASLMGDPSELFQHVLKTAHIDISKGGAEYTEWKERDTPPSGPACPHVIADQIGGDDKYYGLFAWYRGDTIESSCENHLAPARHSSVEEVEKTFSSNPLTRMPGVSPTLITDCLAQRRKIVDADSEGRPRKPPLFMEDEKALLGEYQWSMMNISEHAKGTIEEVAAIDNILGLEGEQMLKTQNGEQLADDLLPGTKEWVDEVKKTCKPSNKLPSGDLEEPVNVFNDMVEKSISAMDKIKKIREAKSRLLVLDTIGIGRFRIVRPGMAGLPATKISDPAKYEQYEKAEKLILSQAPWLSGEMMKKFIGKNPNGVSRAEISSSLRAQLLENRHQLMLRQKRLIEASRCINGNFKGDCVTKFRQTLSELPLVDGRFYFDINSQNVGKKKATDNLVARSYFDQSECRFGIRDAQKTFDNKVSEFRNNVILTVATAGLGSAFSAGRAGLLASRAGAAAGEIGEAVNAGSKAVRAAQVLKAVMLTSAPDLAWAAFDGSKAYQACQDAAENKLQNTSLQLSAGRGPSCGGATAAQLYTTSAYSACLMEAAMVAVDLLPLIPGNLAIFKSVLKPSARLAERGMARDVAEAMVQEIRSNPQLVKQEAKLLKVVEELPRDFVKTKGEGKQLLKFLGELDALHRGTLKPHETAELIKSLDKKALGGLSALVEDAGQILKKSKADVSMTPQRALEQALKERKGLSPETVRAVLECATAIGGGS